jgi:hypothetical protein
MSRSIEFSFFRNLPSVLMILALWISLDCASWAQQAAPAAAVETRASAHRSVVRTMAEVVHSSRPRLRLAQMESVGAAARQEDLPLSASLSDREQHAADSATHALLDHLSRSGGRASALARTARKAARLVDAPNRVLSRLTGADRARLDIRRKRVSFTWFVSFD